MNSLQQTPAIGASPRFRYDPFRKPTGRLLMAAPVAETADIEDKASIAVDFGKVSSTFAGSMDDPHPLYRELRRTHPVMEGDILATFGTWSQAGQATPEHPI